MDRPKYDLKGLGLHRDQVDLLCYLRRTKERIAVRRITMDAALIRTGSLFAATLVLALALIAVFP